MKKSSKNMKKLKTASPELAIVTITEDRERAQSYESLLKASDIPAMVKEQHDELTGDGFAVFVPEDYLDESHVVIESQDAYDDFYDLAIEDDDFDDDFLDDEF